MAVGMEFGIQFLKFSEIEKLGNGNVAVRRVGTDRMDVFFNLDHADVIKHLNGRRVDALTWLYEIAICEMLKGSTTAALALQQEMSKSDLHRMISNTIEAYVDRRHDSFDRRN